jgi:RNA polymerase sigma-70 factor (ECF subfamily)
MSEQELLEMYEARNQAAIQETEERYGAYCHTIAYRILRDEGEAAECLNDTWFAAWQAIPPAKPKNLGAYLTKITRNLSLNRYRSNHQQKRQADRMSVCIDELAECIPSLTTPERAYEQSYLGQLLTQFLRELPKEERIMFVRRYFFMDSVAEVAEHMGCGESKVKTAMFRTRKKLQKLLTEEGIQL